MCTSASPLGICCRRSVWCGDATLTRQGGGHLLGPRLLFQQPQEDRGVWGGQMWGRGVGPFCAWLSLRRQKVWCHPTGAERAGRQHWRRGRRGAAERSGDWMDSFLRGLPLPVILFWLSIKDTSDCPTAHRNTQPSSHRLMCPKIWLRVSFGVVLIAFISVFAPCWAAGWGWISRDPIVSSPI